MTDVSRLLSRSSPEDVCEEPLLIGAIVRLSHLLVCINSSANFLIYFLHGAKFRRAFRQTFVSCCSVGKRGTEGGSRQQQQQQQPV